MEAQLWVTETNAYGQHCLRALSNPSYYNSITFKIIWSMYNELNMPKSKPCLSFQINKYIDEFGSHIFSRNMDIA